MCVCAARHLAPRATAFGHVPPCCGQQHQDRVRGSTDDCCLQHFDRERTDVRIGRHVITSSGEMLQREPLGTYAHECAVPFSLELCVWRCFVGALALGPCPYQGDGCCTCVYRCGPCSWGDSGCQGLAQCGALHMTFRGGCLHYVLKSKARHNSLWAHWARRTRLMGFWAAACAVALLCVRAVWRRIPINPGTLRDYIP